MKQEPQTPQHHPLETRHVFLDTEVYRQFGHNPDAAPLRELGKKVLAGQLILHTTDITLAEISRQLAEYVAESARELKRVGKSVGRLHDRHPDLVAEVPKFDVETVSKAAFQKISRAICETWNAIYHNATAEPALAVFADYFSGRPPFSQAKSKEFPDAFVIKALETWCKEHDERIYVVSKDKAMQEAVSATGVLVAAGSLQDLLAAATIVETPDIIRRADELLRKKSVVVGLQTAIEAKIDRLLLLYGGDFAEGEVTGHSVSGNIEIITYGVIAAAAKDLGVLMDVRIPLSIELSYEDRSDAPYDSEDDTYFGAETADTGFEDDPTIRVFAKLRRKAPHVHSVEILTAELRVQEPYENYK
ncbi:PIN domain-containing protein [Rhizobium leguminosarum]|uniref:PIN domain-containing protein n=1 Tax=Rhizobium leguminosarum TaxID=384 RepID=UPI001FE1B9BB|nr:PIN domain-containing protein [Rhizobium leguminosarum]